MVSELLDGTRVRAAKEGLLKWLGKKWQQVRRGNGQLKDEREREREKKRRTLWRETSRSIRRPEAARSNARIQFPRSFNHFECARFLQLSPSYLPYPFPSFFHSVLVSSRLLAGSRFVILANDVPFFQQPVFSPVIQPHPQKSSPTLRPRSTISPPPPVSLITHEVIKIWQGDNFSNAAYTDLPWTKSETSTRNACKCAESRERRAQRIRFTAVRFQSLGNNLCK